METTNLVSRTKIGTPHVSIGTVGVVGLGYVGLPLALAFGTTHRTVGLDVSVRKIAAYRAGIDPTGEVGGGDFSLAKQLRFTTNAEDLIEADFVVIAVPTPVDESRKPDFSPLISACRAVGPHMKAGAIVIFESTVYPGATEEICVPELERCSGKVWKRDFFVGYSPERINPGDKDHTFSKILKVVSADGPETLRKVAELYSSVVEAGVYSASSIKVAEAAKVIENTQRDLNIALMNELAIICHKINISTDEVLRAAGTKWNFLPFRPGLVGGHCIGVDPYYLTHKAEMLGLHPQVILAGRRINDNMGKFIAEETVKGLIRCGRNVLGSTVNVLGLTFKENCADARNSKVVDVIRELEAYGVQVLVHDPLVEKDEALHEYGIVMSDWEQLPKADAIILAVAHRHYLEMTLERLMEKASERALVVDIKSVLDRTSVALYGGQYWQL